jgi:hypothetical protein
MDAAPDPRRDGVLWGDLEAGWALEALPAPESAGNAAHASAVDWDQDGDLEVTSSGRPSEVEGAIGTLLELVRRGAAAP